MSKLLSVPRPYGRWCRDEAGQAMVEFALVMPILMMLVVGVMEFGRAWNVYQVLTDAAREGARSAVVFDESTTQQDVRQNIESALSVASLDPKAAKVSIDGFRAQRGEPATIAVSYPYEFTFLSRLLRALDFPSSVTLRTQFTMRNE